MPLYYEFRDDGITEKPAEIKGTYMEVVWYGAQPRRYEKSPVNQRTLSEQLQDLFKDFR